MLAVLGTIPLEASVSLHCRCSQSKINGNLKDLAEGFSALNKRLAFDPKLPKIRTWAHSKHRWAQAKHYTDNHFHPSTPQVGRFWTVKLIGRRLSDARADYEVRYAKGKS
jgi:hypothetical protein